MNKLKKLAKIVFERYHVFDCIYVGKYKIYNGVPEIDYCIPWEATDIQEIPKGLREKNPITTECPEECIDDLLRYLLDGKFSFEIPDLIMGDAILYIDKEGEMCYL